MDGSMKRAEIWWADLAEPRGSQPGFRRPVVLVQDDLLTDSRLPTVTVVPLTTNLQRGAAAGNVLLEPRDTGLARPSVALVCQVMTIDKTLLSEHASSLARRVMKRLDDGLRLALGLSTRSG
jgi:mRNA interferase MazF